MNKLRYENTRAYSPTEIEAALRDNDPMQLLHVVVGVALHDEPERAATLCCALASHPHAGVRGNALLGLGHLARLHRGTGLARDVVETLVRSGLTDSEPFVRAQADHAAEDLKHFLGWSIPRPVA